MTNIIIAADGQGAAASSFDNMSNAAITRNTLRVMLRARGHREKFDGKTNTFVIDGLSMTISGKHLQRNG